MKRTLKTIWERTNNSKYLLIIFVIASFLIPFLIGNYSIHTKKQLGLMDGMAEEYMGLGTNLYFNGKYELVENQNFYFRPPGYPYFISYDLKFGDKIHPAEERITKFLTNLHQNKFIIFNELNKEKNG